MNRKKGIRVFALLLAAVTLTAGILFAGCGGQNQETTAAETTAAETTAEETTKEETTAAPGTTAASETAAAEETTEAGDAALADGEYSAEFITDSNMFHVNEANDGKGVLTVKDGRMTIHVALVSKNIVNLFVGTAEDAQKDGAELLQPTVDTVTYSDGASEEVYGFDIPVQTIGEDFDLAILGTKGKWYDHKVSVANPVPAE